MTDRVVVYGSSDDLIGIEGSLSEEFYLANDAEGDILAFSNGWMFRIRYDDDGIWRISLLAEGTPAEANIVQAPMDDDDNYSDRLELVGAIRWVVHGVECAVKKG